MGLSSKLAKLRYNPVSQVWDYLKQYLGFIVKPLVLTFKLSTIWGTAPSIHKAAKIIVEQASVI